MTAGRKPLPDHLKLIGGNAGHRPIDPAGSDKPTPRAEAPECPEFLDAYAREEWTRIAPDLEIAGLLTRIDGAALGIYCSALSLWRRAEEKIQAAAEQDPDGCGLMKKGKNGFEMFTHWLNVRNKAIEQLRAALTDFGMSPSARARVRAMAAQLPLFPGEDPMEGFLRAGSAAAAAVPPNARGTEKR